MKRTQRKTVRTTRVSKNGQVTKLQMAKAISKAQREAVDAMIAALPTAIEQQKLWSQLVARLAALERFQAEAQRSLDRVFNSDLVKNQADFRKIVSDLEEGMPGISMPE